MGVDSNHRSLRRQIYSLLPLATREPIHLVPGNPASKSGAGDGTRTRNLLITNQLLCQLSYASVSSRPGFYRQQRILYTFLSICQPFFAGDKCKKTPLGFPGLHRISSCGYSKAHIHCRLCLCPFRHGQFQDGVVVVAGALRAQCAAHQFGLLAADRQPMFVPSRLSASSRTLLSKWTKARAPLATT